MTDESAAGAGGGADGSRGAGSRRPGAPSQRVTLQSVPIRLALPDERPPDEPSEPAGSGLAFDEHSADGEVHRAGGAREGVAALGPGPFSSMSEADVADGWARLRDGLATSPSPPAACTAPASVQEVLELVQTRSRPPSSPGLDLAREMSDRYALGDFTGALRVAELLLGRDPEDANAQRFAEGCRERLIGIYAARLGVVAGAPERSVGRLVPRVVVADRDVRWLGLDHRQGFVLSRVDGRCSVDELVDVTGMSRLEVLRTLVELVEARAITLR